MALLEYIHTDICYGSRQIIKDVSFSLNPGEILGIIGPSGCGKSTLLKAAVGLLGKKAAVTRGDILYKGTSLVDITPAKRREINGSSIGLIFQDCGSSFCPIRTIGAQLYEAVTEHEAITKEKFREKAAVLLSSLGLEDADRILRSYPFEMSGGMNQRIGIAAAMLQSPKILLADEPTSALDVNVRRQVVEELAQIRREFGTAIIIVSHDTGIIRYLADRVLVMDNGSVTEWSMEK